MMYDFPVHDCTQEQNGSPYCSLRGRLVCVQKDCSDPEIVLPW